VINDFKYNLMRAKAMADGWYRQAHVTVKVHFNPAKVTDPRAIRGTYTCTANAETSLFNPMLFRGKDRKHQAGLKGSGSWTVEQQPDETWYLQLHPDPAPLPEMMAPIEVTLEEE